MTKLAALLFMGFVSGAVLVPSCNSRVINGDGAEPGDVHDRDSSCSWDDGGHGLGRNSDGTETDNAAGDYDALTGSFDVDAGGYGIQCGDEYSTDRSGGLSVVFRNRSHTGVYLEFYKAPSPRIVFALNTGYFFTRGVCACKQVDAVLKQGGCLVYCDEDTVNSDARKPVFLDSCEEVRSANRSVGTYAMADGYHYLKCKFTCEDEFRGEIVDICQRPIPIRSGTYAVTFCMSPSPVSGEGARPAALCGNEYSEITKQVVLGAEDETLVVHIDDGDLP